MGDANSTKGNIMDSVREVVFKQSENLEDSCTKIEGYDFNQGVNYHQLLSSMLSTGFQASNLGEAIQVVNQMLDWRLANESIAEDCSEEERDPSYRESVRSKLFLGFTSNLVSSGVRDTIRYLVQHRMVDVVVTTAGGVEEDLIKCLAPTYKGDFSLAGAALRSKGLNRIGNLLVPNDNYCKFEDWIIPIFDQMLEEQTAKGVLWTPSKLIARLGKEINHESSYLYWAYKNNISVYCPGLTDGSLGDMLYFHSFRNPGLVVDLVQDIRAMNGEAVHASPRKTGMIILGGGLPKHHICNANMMRNGADFAVFINTAQEFDGSDSGARPDEAVSWGKIRGSAKTVKVHCDATIAFPLLVAETLKVFRGEPPDSPPSLPSILDGKSVPQPLSVLRSRLNRGILEFLVQWKGQAALDATWEVATTFQEVYPQFELEDKLILQEGSNVKDAFIGQKYSRAVTDGDPIKIRPSSYYLNTLSTLEL